MSASGPSGPLVCLFDLILDIPINNFSAVRTGLPGFKQYLARINVSCSRTQHSDCHTDCFVLFDLILYVPVNNLSVMSRRVFLG